MELTLVEALQKGIAAHKENKLEDAERFYSAILRFDPDHPETNHNLGVLTMNRGNLEEALSLFKRSLEGKPEVEEFWVSYITCLARLGDRRQAEAAIDKARKLGVSDTRLSELRTNLSLTGDGDAAPTQQEINALLQHYGSGRLDDAEKFATFLIDKYPTHYLSWKVLGALFQKAERFEEACASKQKAAELSPNDPESYYNLGNAQRNLDRFQDAKASYERAIALKPDYARALNNLGTIQLELQDVGGAEGSFRRAVALEPHNATYQNNLGNTLEKRGEPEKALFSHVVALRLKPDFAEALVDFGRSLQQCRRFSLSDPVLYPVIGDLLCSGHSRPADVSPNILNLLRHEPDLRDLLRRSASEHWCAEINDVVTTLEKIPILSQLMRLVPLADLEIERLLVSVRKALLADMQSIEATPEIIAFISTLAIQCFTNEYVYFEGQEERDLVNDLEDGIARVISQQEQPAVLELLCLACYRRLHRYEWCEKVVVLDELIHLKKRLIQDPINELALTKEILQLGTIADGTSSKVREQYEQNPYPRWVVAARSLKPKSVQDYCDDAGIRLPWNSFKTVTAPEVLVAGCGTGQQPIDTAERLAGCHVTAIDLSLASLAYGERHRRELNIDNLEFFQADLLELDKLGKTFDLIQCTGVLHHMEDPITGLKVLEGLLNPGGLIELGLYSELARAEVIEARKQIDKMNVAVSESAIREFRGVLIESDDEILETLATFSDFFSLSEVRDLLFHVQEHRFSLLQISECLHELGLKFCGFKNSARIPAFQKMHGEGADICDLALWHQFEANNPHSFRGMYQFFCQKSTTNQRTSSA